MKKRNRIAMVAISLFISIVSVVIIVNTFLISIVGYHFNSQTNVERYANNLSTQVKTLQAKRGLILDHNGEVLAQDIESYTLYAIVDSSRPSYQNKPSYVVDKEDTARKLAEILNAPEDYILKLLNTATYQTEFGLYGNRLSLELKQSIDALELPGLGFIKQYSRVYPRNIFASSLIGFVAQDTENSNYVGKMGLESYYNDQLAGINGSTTSVVDRYGYTLPGYPTSTTDQIDGKTITLTLDTSIQEQLESSFLTTVDTFDASLAFGGVMEVSTGRILAMGQYPSFDPNQMNVEDFKNYATQYIYEPGSTIKTFTYAAAIDTGVYDGQATFNSSPFLVSIDKNADPYRNTGSNALVIGTIRNAHNKSWGVINYDTGYAYSSNVGIASLLTTRLDLSTFQSYLVRFGFNDSVKVEGLPESTGNINFSWPYEKLTVGFGQGITVSMLQLMQAYTAIMNDGIMVKPYIVDSIKDPLTHETNYQAQVTTIGQPIKAETAQRMQDLMRLVTQDTPIAGTGRAYKVDEVDILAKTGTAQIFENGAYLEDEFLYSVMIGLPADDPQILVYYAFRAPATLNAHFRTDAVKQLLHQVALSYNYRKIETTTEPKTLVLKEFDLPNFTNNRIDYALEYLNTFTSKVYVLGSSDSILDQYPHRSNRVLSTQPIFLLTDTTQVKMIDLTGMSVKDVKAYCDLLSIPHRVEGKGLVVSQSIAVGEVVDASVPLSVVLK